MNIEHLEKLCQQEESGHIEFKREWYWSFTDEVNNGPTNEKWGEFIKDLLAISNANAASFNNKRYIIYGYDDETKTFYDFGLNETNFSSLKNKILQKIASFIEPKIQNIEIDLIQHHYKLIIISIAQHPHLFSLSKNIKTKTIPYGEHSILVRGLKKSDEVSLISTQERINIESLMERTFPDLYIQNVPKRYKTIAATINAYTSINSSLQIDQGYPIKNKELEKYYEIYRLVHELSQQPPIYFIYISDKASQKSTFDLIKANYVFDYDPYVLTDIPLGVNEATRLINLRKASGWTTIYYIQDFGKKFIYPKYLESLSFTEYEQDVFIKSHASSDGSEGYALEFLQDWYSSEEQPLISVTGVGGIGKTTLVKGFLNSICTADSHVLFIDAPTLINELKGKYLYDLYDIYCANSITDTDIDPAHNFPKNLFELSVDNGSLIIVLDGLDEVISGMGSNFNLDDFLQNIVTNYNFNLRKAKIIITCRDSIWESSHVNSTKIKEIYLKPFDDEQAKEFFAKAFESTKIIAERRKNIDKALGLAKQFKTSTQIDEMTYSPFVLDTIYSLIKNAEENEDFSVFRIENSETQRNICLIPNNPNDYLIYKVCEREVRKLKTITIEEQIKIFCYISLFSKGVSNYQFNEIIRQILPSEKINESTEKTLLAHPFLLTTNNGQVSFRYDFFNQFFISLHFSQIIQNDLCNDLDKTKFFDILSVKSGYQNDFSKEIAKRISIDKDDIDIFFIELIEKIQELKKPKFVSDLFILYLSILKSKNKLENQEDINNAMMNCFQTNKIILGLALINVDPLNKKPKLIFNFSGLTVENSHISNYSYFSNCIFDDATIFKDCTIHYGNQRQFGNVNFKPSHFINCNLDAGFQELLDISQNSLLSKEEQAKSNLLRFLALFRKNGKFMPKKQAQIKAKHGELTKQMLELEVIQKNLDSKLNTTEYIINPHYSNELYKYLEQASYSKFAENTLARMI